MESEEARVLRAQLELTQLKQEIERRMNEKDDEMESLRKNQQKQLEALQHSLDAEVKAKNDQVKQRKMVEGQIDDMQSSIDDLDKVSCFSFGIYGEVIPHSLHFQVLFLCSYVYLFLFLLLPRDLVIP